MAHPRRRECAVCGDEIFHALLSFQGIIPGGKDLIAALPPFHPSGGLARLNRRPFEWSTDLGSPLRDWPSTVVLACAR
jgi:hypothetical protein